MGEIWWNYECDWCGKRMMEVPYTIDDKNMDVMFCFCDGCAPQLIRLVGERKKKLEGQENTFKKSEEDLT